MSTLDQFPITRLWPAQHPDRIQLYGLPTPNGAKVSMALEELGLPYEPHLVDIMKDENKAPDYVALNPNAKIPCILDPDGPDGRPLFLVESNNILLYLAEKTGRLIPADVAGRLEARGWLFFQAAHIGPMFGQIGFFNKFAGKAIEDKRPLERYVTESRRLLKVLDERLTARAWLLGDDFSIIDIAHLGWVRNLITFYEAGELVDFESYKQVKRWLETGLARPAVQRGLAIPARPA